LGTLSFGDFSANSFGGGSRLFCSKNKPREASSTSENLYAFYGDDFKVQCPTGSGRYMTLFEVADEIHRRLAEIFLRDANGQRPVYGGTRKFQEDSHWRDLLLFYEYFHGENGARLGARHQTGWTGAIAVAMGHF
jgi:hypothetical protein